jgi:hypothetical protein
MRVGVKDTNTVVIGYGDTSPKTVFQIGSYADSSTTTFTPYVQVGQSSADVQIGGIGGASNDGTLLIEGNSSNYIARFDNFNTTANNTNKILKLVNECSLADVDAAGTNGPRFIEFYIDGGDQLMGYIRGHVDQFNQPGVFMASVSDKRLKENIKPLSLSIDTLLKIEPVEYTWKNSKTLGKGFIAQDLYKVYPEAVFKSETDDIKKDPWTIDQTQLIPLLVKSVQDQQKIIDELKEKIINLENKLK